MILPVDKGNATVVMNKDECEGKLKTMLADGTYKRLKRDPTAKTERQIGAALRETEDGGPVSPWKVDKWQSHLCYIGYCIPGISEHSDIGHTALIHPS